nr:MAG TPA: hypothetical protein [Caudoviricetes sp.]
MSVFIGFIFSAARTISFSSASKTRVFFDATSVAELIAS